MDKELRQMQKQIAHIRSIRPESILPPNERYRYGIKDLEMFVKSGDELSEVKIGLDRHGFSVIVADSRKAAEKISKRLDDIINIEYERNK